MDSEYFILLLPAAVIFWAIAVLVVVGVIYLLASSLNDMLCDKRLAKFAKEKEKKNE